MTLISIIISLFLAGINYPVLPSLVERPTDMDKYDAQEQIYDNVEEFVITAYNTVPSQTWDDPCISASGDNICGRDDVVACPRRFEFGSKFVIDGKEYECLDRTSLKYDNRLDISFDKDIDGAIKWGKQIKKVKIKL